MDNNHENKVQQYGPCLVTVNGEVHATLGEEWNGAYVCTSDYRTLEEANELLVKENKLLLAMKDATNEYRKARRNDIVGISLTNARAKIYTAIAVWENHKRWLRD